MLGSSVILEMRNLCYGLCLVPAGLCLLLYSVPCLFPYYFDSPWSVIEVQIRLTMVVWVSSLLVTMGALFLLVVLRTDAGSRRGLALALVTAAIPGIYFLFIF